MKKTIYVCTEGEYSEYHICGVFDKKELAEKFCERFGCQIDEYKLNPFTLELKKGYSPHFVRITKSGAVLEARIIQGSYGFENGVSHGFDIDKHMFIHCMAKSDKHAVKIANDLRASLIASDQWPV